MATATLGLVAAVAEGSAEAIDQQQAPQPGLAKARPHCGQTKGSSHHPMATHVRQCDDRTHSVERSDTELHMSFKANEELSTIMFEAESTLLSLGS